MKTLASELLWAVGNIFGLFVLIVDVVFSSYFVFSKVVSLNVVDNGTCGLCWEHLMVEVYCGVWLCLHWLLVWLCRAVEQRGERFGDRRVLHKGCLQFGF